MVVGANCQPVLYLDVVRMTGAVDVTVMSVFSRVLDSRRVDGNASSLLLRRFVNVFIGFEFTFEFLGANCKK